MKKGRAEALQQIEAKTGGESGLSPMGMVWFVPVKVNVSHC